MPTDRNPRVIFADEGVQKCYDTGLKKIKYFEKMMDKNLSSPQSYRLYQKLAEEFDNILGIMRDNVGHVPHKVDLGSLLKSEMSRLSGRMIRLI